MSYRVTWIRIGDFYPDLKAEQDHFLALDGKSAVGIVRLIESGARMAAAGIGAWCKSGPESRSRGRGAARGQPAARRGGRWSRAGD